AVECNLPPRLSTSAWTADRAVDFLNSPAAKESFFLNIGFSDPHHPHALHKEKADTLDTAKTPLPHYVEGELDDKPPVFRAAHEGKLNKSEFRGRFGIAGQWAGESNVTDYRLVTEDAARLARAYYYGLVEQIDDGVARIIAALKASGQYDNTMIIFSTDHGELLGDHGLWMKGPFHYEQLVRVPLIIKWPGQKYKGQTDALVSLADIMPTVLAATGGAVPADIDGVDLTSIVAGQKLDVHEYVTVHCVDDPEHIRIKSVITKKYKLTFYYGCPYGELYDLQNDPWEVKNLWGEPEYKDIKIDLLAMLVNHAERLEKRLARYSYA
ncbi:MAG: sulfatase-like hydrolase/transferase, partial [Clostridia bacterium]|nr:sulfatase-like hydrolase/transferase [Clostridia bacterium]